MSIILDTITLPPDLWWEDETDWSPVAQSDTEFSISGSLLVDTSLKLSGRPITLSGDESSSWVPRSTVLAVMALAAVPGKTFTLNLNGRLFTVMFFYGDGKPVEAVPVYKTSPPADGDTYQITIRLIEV